MKAIITDYDYTLSDKFMSVEFLHVLEDMKVTKPGYKKEYADIQNVYGCGKIKYDDFVQKDMALICKYLKGVSYTDVLKVLREDFNPAKNLFDWSKEITKIFKKDQWIFIIVSSTIGFCLEGVQDTLNFDTYLASNYEVRNSVFTGEFSCKVQAEQKGQYVAGLKGSFEKIVVVGDAPGDFKMLEFADSAFLFEPKESTLKEAKGLNVEIVNRENILDKLRKEV